MSKAKCLGFPNAKLKVTIYFDSTNSGLVRVGVPESISTYDLVDIVERGVLIGKIGHLQLIEWNYVKDIF